MRKSNAKFISLALVFVLMLSMSPVGIVQAKDTEGKVSMWQGYTYDRLMNDLGPAAVEFIDLTAHESVLKGTAKLIIGSHEYMIPLDGELDNERSIPAYVGAAVLQDYDGSEIVIPWTYVKGKNSFQVF